VPVIRGMNGAYALHFRLIKCVLSEIGARLWLIIDIFLISDGWSYSRDPGRIPGRTTW
jgi:hypothetical protein